MIWPGVLIMEWVAVRGSSTIGPVGRTKSGWSMTCRGEISPLRRPSSTPTLPAMSRYASALRRGEGVEFLFYELASRPEGPPNDGVSAATLAASAAVSASITELRSAVAVEAPKIIYDATRATLTQRRKASARDALAAKWRRNQERREAAGERGARKCDQSFPRAAVPHTLQLPRLTLLYTSSARLFSSSPRLFSLLLLSASSSPPPPHHLPTTILSPPHTHILLPAPAHPRHILHPPLTASSTHVHCIQVATSSSHRDVRSWRS